MSVLNKYEYVFSENGLVAHKYGEEVHRKIYLIPTYENGICGLTHLYPFHSRFMMHISHDNKKVSIGI